MIVTVERRKRRLVVDSVVIGQIAKLVRNHDRLTTGARMIVFDDDIDLGQMLFHRGFEIAKADRLQAHVGIVKIPDGRLNK